METAAVRDIKSRYIQLWHWIEEGEAMILGRPVTEFDPIEGPIDWSASAAVRRDRSTTPVLSRAVSLALIQEGTNQW